MQEFGEKSDDLMGVFNSCWVFERAKCGVYKPKWVDYKPYLGMWKDDINFVASLWTSARTDCEVVAGIYEVGLHGKRRGATFAASMSAGRILKSPIVKRVRKEKN